jgi:hypothetical protein
LATFGDDSAMGLPGSLSVCDHLSAVEKTAA